MFYKHRYKNPQQNKKEKEKKNRQKMKKKGQLNPTMYNKNIHSHQDGFIPDRQG
jgi:hypothetical protein